MALVGDIRLLRRDETTGDKYLHAILEIGELSFLRRSPDVNFLNRELLPEDLGKTDWRWSGKASHIVGDSQLLCVYGIHVDVTTPESKRIQLLDIEVGGLRRGRFDLTTFYLPFPRTDEQQDEGYYYSPIAYFSTPCFVEANTLLGINPHGDQVDALAPLLGFMMEVDGRTVSG